MPIELMALAAATVLGAAQFILAKRNPVFAQIQRNFLETYFIVALIIVVLAVMQGFGEWSMKGAVIYLAGRVLYVIFSFGILSRVRKWTWAVSILGLVGCAAQLLKVLLDLAI